LEVESKSIVKKSGSNKKTTDATTSTRKERRPGGGVQKKGIKNKDHGKPYKKKNRICRDKEGQKHIVGRGENRKVVGKRKGGFFVLQVHVWSPSLSLGQKKPNVAEPLGKHRKKNPGGGAGEMKKHSV